jgi:hypothetical protein
VTSNYYDSNVVNQQGSHNIGMVNNNAPADPQAAFRDMVNAIQTLRGQVPPDDRQVLDESMHVIRAGGKAEPQRLRRAFRDVLGIATVVGQVGAPVVEAVRKVMAAFGM